jgi:hypothetical protein
MASMVQPWAVTVHEKLHYVIARCKRQWKCRSAAAPALHIRVCRVSVFDSAPCLTLLRGPACPFPALLVRRSDQSCEPAPYRCSAASPHAGAWQYVFPLRASAWLRGSWSPCSCLPPVRSDNHRAARKFQGSHFLFFRASSRICDKVRVGVIASGSIRQCTIAGLPELSARSKAGANSSVVSTRSPWPPKAFA